MHCFVITLLKYLAIRVELFLALHKIPRMKSDNDLISASLAAASVIPWQPGPWLSFRYHLVEDLLGSKKIRVRWEECIC
ncbi:MAG: hypothetical protein ACFWUL_11160 [Dialister sp.]